MKQYNIKTIKNKRILGRNAYDDSKEDLALFWGGSALEINIRGREAWACISADYDHLEIWLAVEINGALVSRFMLDQGKKWYCLARNLNPQKENLISIIKDTQPMNEDDVHSMVIHEIGLDEEAEFAPISPRKCSIEFIGDSITSGEGAVGAPEEMDWIPTWISASKTYAIRLAKKLNADWNTMGKSGWGICWSWDFNRDCNIPQHYENVCSVLNEKNSIALGAHEAWTFNGGKGSDYVVINLGTNDETGIRNAQDKEGLPEQVVSSVKSFLSVIRSHNPNAKIIWVWGLLKLEFVPSLIQKGVEEYKAESGDKNIFTLELESSESLEIKHEDKGSRGHPGEKTHEKAAESIAEFILTD